MISVIYNLYFTDGCTEDASLSFNTFSQAVTFCYGLRKYYETSTYRIRFRIQSDSDLLTHYDSEDDIL